MPVAARAVMLRRKTRRFMPIFLAGHFRLGALAVRSLKAFRANQGLLLAGAVAYYALLSLVPMLILALIGFSHLVEPQLLLDTLERYLGWLLPGEAKPVIAQLQVFIAHREVLGWVLAATMLFFSSLAFTVLENAMSIIFHHRVTVRRRRFLVSALLPYCYIVFLGAGFLVVTLVAGEVLIVTSIYLVMPVGRLLFRDALIGGVLAAVLWEITRHVLVWYFARLSKIGVVYGSLATAIVVLLSLEIGATLLLFGAQVISEYERLNRPGA